MHPSGDHHHPGPRPGTSHPPLRRRLAAAAVAAGLGLGLAFAGGPPAGAAPTTEVTARVSVTSTGAQSPKLTDLRTLVDPTGRYVAFSGAGVYDPATDTNGKPDVYVRDLLAGLTTRVSLTDTEAQLAGNSILCGASADLRFVAFWSNATNLPSGGTGQVYLRDRTLGQTRIVSLGAGGLASTKPGGGSGMYADDRCDVSADGRYVVFSSEGNGFVADGNGVADVFRRDRTTGTTIRVSVKDDETEITGGDVGDPQISDDGNRVVFSTTAPVSANDGNGLRDIFLRDIGAQTTNALSARYGTGAYTNGSASGPAISGDGTVIAFATQATDLVPEEDDENGSADDVYAMKIGSPKTLASVSSTEVQGDAASWAPSLSADGRYVAFSSAASNLWPLEGNNGRDVLLRDRQLGLTTLASRRVESSVTSAVPSVGSPAVSADGTAVAFVSIAPDLVRKDTNGVEDVFVRDADVSQKPFGSFDELVAQQFADFLGRAPTAAEATEWRARLRHGELSPDEVIADLAHSTTWSQRRAPVTRLYWAFFLRAPDKAGLDYWVQQNAAGKGLHTIASQFTQSKEFKDTYGSLSNQAFVTLVYQNVLERDPADDEVAYWSGQLASGARTRGSVMVGFSESAEGRAFLAPQVDVTLIHLGMLRAMPSTNAFTSLAAFLDSGEPLEELVVSVRGSAEYLDRVS